MIGHAVGGFAVGFLEKSFPNLPSLPIVGKKGAIAIGAYLLRNQSPILVDVALSAAAISGYQLGSTGSVTGDVLGDEEDAVAAQM
jgi:precorrin isomerase